MNFAGLDLSRPRIMGIINVTPDSFADAGETFDHSQAIDRGFQHMNEGADIIDVGGESTRPGAVPVSVEEECRRIIPVVEALARRNVPVSVDTRHAEVMIAGLNAGARVINDVSALSYDQRSLEVAATHGADVILMHMRGAPDTMAGHTSYSDVLSEVRGYLQGRLKTCREAGIRSERLCVDPGIVHETPGQNFELLDRLQDLTVLQRPILVGFP